MPGLGVAATIGNRHLILGNARLMAENGIDLAPLAADAAAMTEAGHTVSFLAETAPERRATAVLGFSDTIKPGAKQAIAQLHRMGLRTVMLTGDAAGAARAVAAQLGIDEVQAGILPQGKAEAVAAARHPVAMVGDGINDAPALAAADVGIAMGGGTDVAMETAGITLMRGDLSLVADAIEISRQHGAENPAGAVLGVRLQRAGDSAGGVGLSQPDGGGRGDGAVLGQRGLQCAAAAAVAALNLILTTAWSDRRLSDRVTGTWQTRQTRSSRRSPRPYVAIRAEMGDLRSFVDRRIAELSAEIHATVRTDGFQREPTCPGSSKASGSRSPA